ncbi:MAG: hypothetical protein R8K20_12000 [Gallionellaceae bacterium]
MGYLAAGAISGAGKAMQDSNTAAMKARVDKAKAKYASDHADARQVKLIKANADNTKATIAGQNSRNTATIAGAKDVAKAKAGGVHYQTVKDADGNEHTEAYVVKDGKVQRVDIELSDSEAANATAKIDHLISVVLKLDKKSPARANGIAKLRKEKGITEAQLARLETAPPASTPEPIPTPAIRTPLMVPPSNVESAAFKASRAGSDFGGKAGEAFNKPFVDLYRAGGKYVGQPIIDTVKGISRGVQ